jgi:hypothetical protein
MEGNLRQYNALEFFVAGQSDKHCSTVTKTEVEDCGLNYCSVVDFNPV